MTEHVPAAVVGVVVTLAALAGVLLSNWAAESADAPAARASALAPTATPAALQRALPAAAERLVQARRAGRLQLAVAQGSQQQAAAAERLAAVYDRASERLAKPAEAVGATVLLGAMDRVSHAYRLLATAARARDRPGYKVAKLEVADAERAIPAELADALADAG